VNDAPGMTNPLPSLDPTQLATVTGGGGFFSNMWNTAMNTIGYAGPSAASDAPGAILPAAGAAALAPQGMARNGLINSLANGGTSPAQQNAAFNRYSSGPGQKLAGHVSKW
jgi:hypothetical protein